MSTPMYPRGKGYREQACCANCIYGGDTSKSELAEYRCFKHVPKAEQNSSWVAPRVDLEDVCDEWEGLL